MRRFLVSALVLSTGLLTGIGVAGSAVIVGTNGPDRLSGTPRADDLYGRGGTDHIEGRAGSDLIDGGAGRDRLSGSAGNDRLAASGDGRVDVVRCGGGRDIVNAELADKVGADCEVVSRQLSRDAERSSAAQHETQVEPDSFAFGSTIVAVFQSGRFEDGGAANTGFATSRDAGRTWRSGFLPGLSTFSRPPGQHGAVSDPTIAFDAIHRFWLAASLAGELDVTGILISRSRDGLTWRLPVSAASSSTEEYDKEWLVCDNWPRSRFRGRCYLSYLNVTNHLIETRSSRNGGRTWSAPVGVSVRRPTAVVNGVQPVVRPNGDLVVVFSVFGAISVFTDEIAAMRSIDGGASFSDPVRVAPLEESHLIGMRAPPLPSAEVDGAGTIYVAWSDCQFSDQCTADIVLARSPDGVSWTAPTRVPIGVAGSPVNHFLPGLAVDPGTSGRRARIAVLYHSLRDPEGCDPVFSCLGVDVGLVTSRDGGATWASPQLLSVVSMPLWWIADSDLGRMLGDYVSASWVRGRPVPVFALALEPSAGLFHQAIFATTRMR